MLLFIQLVLKFSSSLAEKDKKLPREVQYCDSYSTTDITVCSKCIKGYGLDYDSNDKPLNSCSKCPEYCLSCSRSDWCEICDSYSYFIYDEMGHSTGRCEFYPKNCTKQNNKCECPYGQGHLLDKNGNQTGYCVPCEPNCYECQENAEICTSCRYQYGPVLDENGSNTGKCRLCEGECQYCENNYKICTTCIGGPELDENGEFTGKCFKCPHCQNCKKNYKFCDECSEEFGPVLDSQGKKTGKCSRCGEGCERCEDDYRVCTRCATGYGLVKSTGKCSPCPANCFGCEYSDFCDECLSNYGPVLGPDGEPTGKCKICPDGCHDCDDDSDFCNECTTSTMFDENGKETGRCGFCQENCDECYEKTGLCKRCYYGYGLEINLQGKSTGKCLRCSEGCSSCGANSAVCDYCNTGYGLANEEEKKCKKCQDGCEMCYDDYTKCIKCYDGYANFDSQCIKCPDNCLNCDHDPAKCSVCYDGYGFEIGDDNVKTGKCVKCIENCRHCGNNSKVCIVCEDGFGFAYEDEEKGTMKCVKCPENCVSCLINATKCTLCNEGYGYVLDDQGESTGKCGKCPANCDECYLDHTICNKCATSFGHNKTNGNNKAAEQCVPCESKYCSDCNTDYTYCRYCLDGGDHYSQVIGDDGFYTGKCMSCPIECYDCDTKQCLSCNAGYGPIIDGSPNIRCGKCPDNCFDCEWNNQICKECLIGYDFERDENDKITGKCIKCPDNCGYCSNSQTCDKCWEGFVLDENRKCVPCPDGCLDCYNPNSNSCINCLDGYYSSGDKCLKCVENCEYCYRENKCERCIEGFEEVSYPNDTKLCVPCPENCAGCYGKDLGCTRCFDGYGFKYENGIRSNKCAKCEDKNCLYCQFDTNDCYNCKKGYCIESPANSPYNHYCVPCSDDTEEPTKCLVEGCIKCVPQTSDKCQECESSLILDENMKCVKPSDITPKPEPTPVVIEVDHKEITDGKYSPDLDSKYEDAPSLEIQFNFYKDKDVNEVVIKNEKKRKVIFTIPEGFTELTFSVSSKSHDEFDLINSADNIKINLDQSASASIKQGKGQIEINSTKENDKVNLKQVQPASKDFTIIPITQVVIKEVQFSETGGALIVQSDDNKKVEVQSIKVQPGREGKIENAKIKGEVTFASFSNLNINEKVDLSESTLDFSYSTSALGNKGKAPLSGVISGKPKGITITSRKDSTWLDVEKLLLAESTNEFDCESWGDMIDFKSSGKLNDHSCQNENNVHRLFAVENPDKKSDGGGKGLNGGVIAAIVIAVVVVVGAIVFVLVYFLVIKKRRSKESSVSEGDNKNADEV